MKVRTAIREGRFVAGMVSTKLNASNHAGNFVICVFTANWQDREDVARAREALRELGATEELGYKRDIETFNGVYGTPDEWFHRE